LTVHPPAQASITPLTAADTYTLQKTNRELSARIGTLEKRNQTLGKHEQDLSREIQELKADNEVLRQNRASLVDRTLADGSLSDNREKQWKEEKVCLSLTGLEEEID
jgi:predicted RNase H-like nuclease (RuvC/YqgF family)